MICHALSLDGIALVWTDMGRGSVASVPWDVRSRNSGTAAAADPIEIARDAISFCYKGRADILGTAGVDRRLFHDWRRNSLTAAGARLRSCCAAGERQRGGARHSSFAAWVSQAIAIPETTLPLAARANYLQVPSMPNEGVPKKRRIRGYRIPPDSLG